MKKKKIKKAVALQYNRDDRAPKVIALGKGLVADKILEKAKEENVPIYNDPKLAETLNQLNIGDEIPPALYEVVAEILIFVSDLDVLQGDRKNE